MKIILPTLIAAALPCAALAYEGVTIEDAYARGPSPKSGAAFMLIENHGTTDCTLNSVATDAAERVSLHRSSEVDGVMKMKPINDGITIPAGGEHLLKRGGDHVMMMGLTSPFEDGKSINMTFDFGDCGTKDIEINIDNKRDEDSTSAGDHEHKHDH